MNLMPNFQFDNRVSWMDIVTLMGAGMAGIYLIFAIQADIATAQEALDRIEGDYKQADVRIENRVVGVSHDSKERHEKVLREVKDVRKENKEAFNKLEGKIDQLIQRELNHNYNGNGNGNGNGY